MELSEISSSKPCDRAEKTLCKWLKHLYGPCLVRKGSRSPGFLYGPCLVRKGSRTITYLVWIWVRVLVEVVHDSDGADVDEAHPARLVEGALRCRRIGTV